MKKVYPETLQIITLFCVYKIVRCFFILKKKPKEFCKRFYALCDLPKILTKIIDIGVVGALYRSPGCFVLLRGRFWLNCNPQWMVADTCRGWVQRFQLTK